ncbi:MAG: symporter-like protein [Beijerinckiaceae bacterium]
MKKPLTDEDLQERASIDGRVSFALAAFALGAGLVALLDRVGVPERIVGILGPILALCGLSLIGLLLHAVRVSRFYAAGRSAPPPYAGLALVALATALTIPYMPPASVGVPMHAIGLGFAIGFLAIALLNGPLLRKTGAFSLPDLIAGRFPHAGVRLASIAIVGAAALLLALAGFESSIKALAYALGAERKYAAILVAFVLVLMIAPGGMGGVVWAATGSAGVFVAALCLPLASILIGGDALPAPIAGGDQVSWDKALARIAEWQTLAAAEAPAGGNLAVIATLAIGVACLAPLLSPAITTADSHAARRAGFSALIWGLLIAAIVAVSMAVSALVLDEYLVGERPDRLPSFAYAASGGGLLRICGVLSLNPEKALEACKAATGMAGLVLRPQDFTPQGIWLLLGLPEFYGYGVAFSGLIAAAIVSMSLVLASAGFQAFGTAIGHDGLYRVRDSSALTSRRLAMTRVVIILAVIASAAFLSVRTADTRLLIGLAILFSAATMAPLLALALWPRASGNDAATALLASLAMAAVVVGLHGTSPDIGVLAVAAVAAAISGVVVGVGVSFLHSGGLATEGSAFVHGVLHGETDILNRDKAA